MLKRGFFITFEGGEGCGKSTQAKLLAIELEKAGIPTVLTREPGGTFIGEAIREILLKGDQNKIDDITETLLFFADRREHLQKKIFPALKENKCVISDRYADSTLAYQVYGHQKNVNREIFDMLYKIVAGIFEPDLTFLLDMEVEKGLKRAFGRGLDEERFENMNIDFHHNLRKGFLEIAQNNQQRFHIINADKNIPDISAEIIQIALQRILSDKC